MTQSSALHQQPRPVPTGYRSVPREFVDPPAAWNPTVALFLGGYVLAGFTIWGWFLEDAVYGFSLVFSAGGQAEDEVRKHAAAAEAVQLPVTVQAVTVCRSVSGSIDRRQCRW